jgi:hypothetical protein
MAERGGEGLRDEDGLRHWGAFGFGVTGRPNIVCGGGGVHGGGGGMFGGGYVYRTIRYIPWRFGVSLQWVERAFALVTHINLISTTYVVVHIFLVIDVEKYEVRYTKPSRLSLTSLTVSCI